MYMDQSNKNFLEFLHVWKFEQYYSKIKWKECINGIARHTSKVYTDISESERCLVMSNSATPWTIQSMEFSRPEYWSG